MANILYPFPRTFSFNGACDKIEQLYNPNYRPLADDMNTPVKASSINDSVTFFYVNGELVAVYDEVSGDLYTTFDL